MIAAIRHRTLLPLMVMLIALAGMTLSTIGEASSHGIAELTEFNGTDHGDHAHSHDLEDHGENSHSAHQHHDSGNHTHETADRLTVNFAPAHVISHRQALPFAGASPQNFRYRLERPPKPALIG
ncbi:hypothetical protein [Marinobacter sp.]|uniref:hypothetical protein n=1 Tax=Marinobacter sp. TaxID=50741 RepID=UPI001A03B7C9|nr:hypothetical protein [Marinobacter sp.]MBE0485408.1 hypothetical protein [Marinobacter sp.]